MGYEIDRIPAQVDGSVTYQDYLDRDRKTPPASLRQVGRDASGDADIAPARYVSREFYERERGMWDKVWQIACREEHVPNVGDVHVYEVCNRSYLIVRSGADEIQAFVNACPHRGRKIRSGPAWGLKHVQCPFHGISWALNGAVKNVPLAWDFTDHAKTCLSLSPVRVGRFAGWVFINPDPTAMALEDYLKPVPEHFAPYLWDQTYLALHVGKLLRGNWKLVQEAFMESFHVRATHPQIMGYIDDVGCQYDRWADAPHAWRMIVPYAVPSANVRDQMSEQDVLDAFSKRLTSRAAEGAKVGTDQNARQIAANRKRAGLEDACGVDLAHVSDAELIDGFYYNLFPNLMHFSGYGPNMWYRFRPWHDDHEATLMEVGMIMRHRREASKPAPAPYVQLDFDEPWASHQPLADVGVVLDQDTSNMYAVHQGLKASFAKTIVTATYQEQNIRRFHATLDGYIDR